MAETRTLKVVVVGNAKSAQSALKALGADANSAGSRVDQASSKWGQFGAKLDAVGERAATVGQSMTTAVSLPVAGVGVTALRMSADFESSMNRVRAITGASGEQFEDLTALAKELGSTTQYSASQSADAMGYLAMAGFNTNQIIDALPGTLSLAAAAQIDLAQAADIASNVLSGYGFQAQDIGRVNDVLAKTFTSANVDISMLGETFKYVGPVAKSAGLEFEEVSAAVGLLGNAGIQGSEAGTALRGAIARLLKPTAEVTDTLDRLGVKVTDSKGNLRSLTDIFGQLEKSGATTTDMLTIFGVEAGPGMQAILSQGAGALDELTGKLRDSGGTADHIAKTQMEGLNGSLSNLESAFEGLMIAIGDSGLLEWATEATNKLTSWVSKVSETDSAMLQMAAKVALVAAAIGPLLFVVGKLVSVFTSSVKAVAKFATGVGKAVVAAGKGAVAFARLAGRAAMASGRVVAAGARMGASAGRAAAKTAAAGARIAATWIRIAAQAMMSAARIAVAWLISLGPVGLVIAAVAAVIAIVVLLWQKSETFRKIVTAVWNAVKSAVLKVVNWFKDKVPKIWSALVAATKERWNALKQTVARVVNAVKGAVSAAWNTVKSKTAAVWNGIKNAVKTAVNKAVDTVKGIKGKVTGIFKGAGSWLFEAGKKILKGLINGISNMVGKLKDKLRGVTNLIPDWKGPLDKDRVLLRPAGEAIMGGLVAGFDRGTPRVKATLTRLTGDIGSVGRGTARRALAAAPYSGGPTVIVNVAGTVIAERDLVRTISTQVRDRIARNGRRNGGRTGV